jgi:hypothetical protein
MMHSSIPGHDDEAAMREVLAHSAMTDGADLARNQAMARAAMVRFQDVFQVDGFGVPTIADGHCLESSMAIALEKEGFMVFDTDCDVRSQMRMANERVGVCQDQATIARLNKPSESLYPDDFQGLLMEKQRRVMFVDIVDDAVTSVIVVGARDAMLAKTVIVLSPSFGGHGEPFVMSRALDENLLHNACKSHGISWIDHDNTSTPPTTTTAPSASSIITTRTVSEANLDVAMIVRCIQVQDSTSDGDALIHAVTNPHDPPSHTHTHTHTHTACARRRRVHGQG